MTVGRCRRNFFFFFLLLLLLCAFSSYFSYPSIRPFSEEFLLMKQSKEIAEELDGFTFPSWEFVDQASTLTDLIPDSGGKALHNIVITTWRSGSSFLGDLLNSHPGVFYHFEPFLDYESHRIRKLSPTRYELRRLEQMLLCNFTEVEDFINYVRIHDEFYFKWNFRLNKLGYPQVCRQSRFMSKFCRLFPFHVMKIVRLPLKFVDELLSNKKLNVRIVLLIRDPRGTINSRRETSSSWCTDDDDCGAVTRLCEDLEDDFMAAADLAKTFPHRFLTVRFEDLALDPYKVSANILNFFGLDFHPSVKNFLDTHTREDSFFRSPHQTYRNSSAAAFVWRNKLPYKQLMRVEEICAGAMESWGYVPISFGPSLKKGALPIRNYTLTQS